MYCRTNQQCSWTSDHTKLKFCLWPTHPSNIDQATRLFILTFYWVTKLISQQFMNLAIQLVCIFLVHVHIASQLFGKAITDKRLAVFMPVSDPVSVPIVCLCMFACLSMCMLTLTEMTRQENQKHIFKLTWPNIKLLVMQYVVIYNTLQYNYDIQLLHKSKVKLRMIVT